MTPLQSPLPLTGSPEKPVRRHIHDGTRKLAKLFTEANPGTWFDGKYLATIAGGYAWRTRVSECRTDLGLPIVNRQRSVRDADGKVLYRVSEYSYVPAGTRTEAA